MTKQIFLDTDPDNQYVKEKYVISVDMTEKLLATPEGQIRYAKKVLRQQLGDEVEFETIKYKEPKLTTRGLARLLKKDPQARLYVVTKF